MNQKHKPIILDDDEQAVQASEVQATVGDKTPPTSQAVSVEDILNELGLDKEVVVPEVKLPEKQEKPKKEPKAKKEKAEKSAKEKKPKKAEAKVEVKKEKEKEVKEDEKQKKGPVSRIPIDAPIPYTEFRGLLIGVYGNILEELEEPDANGYKHAEIKLERYNPKAHEQFRNTNGRMLLLIPQGGSTYMVVAENPDGTREPVIEVTNKGRGRLRCRQLAQALGLAYMDKEDQEIVDFDSYNKLKEKIKTISAAGN